MAPLNIQWMGTMKGYGLWRGYINAMEGEMPCMEGRAREMVT